MLRLSALLPMLAFAAVDGARPTIPVDLLISSASVVDVAAGRVEPSRTVAVRGDEIVAVVPDAEAGRFSAKTRFDARGRFVIPGLWDMHVHFGGGPALAKENRALLPIYVAYGVTTVRDCAGDLSDEVLGWRAAVASGVLLGPTIYTSGPKIEGRNSIWPGDLEVSTPAELTAALDRLRRLRVDFVKLTDNTLKPELFTAALPEIRRRGLKSSAHVPLPVGIEQAVDLGLGSVEHMDYLVKAGSTEEAAVGRAYAAGKLTYAEAFESYIETFDPARARRVFRRMAAKGTAVTPTLNISRILSQLDREDHSADPELALLGPGLKATYRWRLERAAQAGPAAMEAKRRLYAKSAALLPMARDAGVLILAGTDAGFLNAYDYPGEALHDELALFVAHGLTPAEALRTATVNGPAWMGRSDRYGAVAAGKQADLVVLDRDPLLDIGATRAVTAVVLKGRLLDRAALDRLLRTAREEVSAAAAVPPSAVERPSRRGASLTRSMPD